MFSPVTERAVAVQTLLNPERGLIESHLVIHMLGSGQEGTFLRLAEIIPGEKSITPDNIEKSRKPVVKLLDRPEPVCGNPYIVPEVQTQIGNWLMNDSSLEAIETFLRQIQEQNPEGLDAWLHSQVMQTEPASQIVGWFNQ
jgi:hypothetical protein